MAPPAGQQFAGLWWVPSPPDRVQSKPHQFSGVRWTNEKKTHQVNPYVFTEITLKNCMPQCNKVCNVVWTVTNKNLHCNCNVKFLNLWWKIDEILVFLLSHKFSCIIIAINPVSVCVWPCSVQAWFIPVIGGDS